MLWCIFGLVLLSGAVDSAPLFKCKPLDMTYNINAEMPLYPVDGVTGNRYRQEVVFDGMLRPAAGFDPFYVTYNKFAMVEHAGTHIDAPNHIGAEASAKLMPTIEKVPIQHLVGEACVIDIPEWGRNIPDYLITIDDLRKWEMRNGRLHDQCFVIVRTGHGLKWPDPVAYFGVENEEKLNTKNSNGWPNQLHWPGMSPQAADWLVKNRGLVAFGMDAVSIDAGQVIDLKHSVILGSNHVGVENMANVHMLPVRGATIIALPLKLENGSGAPARIVAYGWNGENDPCRTDYSGYTR